MNIKVDLTQLGETIKVYDTAVNDLDSAINSLKSTDWKSGASWH